jgi:hypothetical protein
LQKQKKRRSLNRAKSPQQAWENLESAIKEIRDYVNNSHGKNIKLV